MATPFEEARALAEDHIERLGWPATTRRLFGTVALYREGRIFGMVWRGTLYFKVNEETRADYVAAGAGPFVFVSRAGEEQALKSCWEVPAEVIEDNDTLRDWAARAWRAARSG